MQTKQAIVIHSGGMDSSICLALAIKEFGNDNVLSLSFDYQQRHRIEQASAAKICQIWSVDHKVIRMDYLSEITTNALLDHNSPIQHEEKSAPNTLVLGRNGLMARLGAIYASHFGAHYIYMGIIEVEGNNSGYRDCSRHYMDLKQTILRIDLDDPLFEIRTPLVKMTKKETMYLAHDLGVLSMLLKETVTCYEGILQQGCGICPACKLRNEGLKQFINENPNFVPPYVLGNWIN